MRTAAMDDYFFNELKSHPTTLHRLGEPLSSKLKTGCSRLKSSANAIANRK